MKEGNNNNSDSKSFLPFFTENSRHIAMKMFMNATLFDFQNVENCISEDLDLNTFMGDHVPSPPRLKGPLRRPFSKQAAAYVPNREFSEIPVS